jgi:hypothetical protein
MKLSADTVSLLQSFAKINSGIEFKAGNVIKTISTTKTLLAKATVKDTFPSDFCVGDLNQFLMIYNQKKDPELDFDKANIYIKTNRSTSEYRKTARDTLVVAPDKDIVLTTEEIKFTLTDSDFASILKMAAILQTPHISVESDGEKVYIVCCDCVNDAASKDSTEVAKGTGNKYKMVFLTDNLKMIPGTYYLTISSKGLSHFKNANADLEYWCALESKFSKYGE